MKRVIAIAFLWLFVLLAGIVSGGTIYDGFVVEPLWAGSPPESVRQWTHGVLQGKFFGKFTPFFALVSLALAGTAWFLPKPQRKWALAAGLAGLGAVIMTLVFFLPIAVALQSQQGQGLSDQEIMSLIQQWNWQWIRTVLLLGSWVLGLRALSLSDTHSGM
jgi:hypothetical protein